ncbi:hypothetical protein BDV59DRAFT_173201 [Aspergillus ambiguus]|uniref:uncharacterized protein n=1 Tax=Aspergillus ambiguus TaxID=176160 RepID=UPI003CCDEEBF
MSIVGPSVAYLLFVGLLYWIGQKGSLVIQSDEQKKHERTLMTHIGQGCQHQY